MSLVETVSVGEWPIVSRLVERACQVPEEGREAWLLALPPEEAHWASVLREVLSGAGRVRTAGLPPPLYGGAGAAGPASGTHIGAYRITRELGTGGMGSVWLAERADGLIKRPVALKLPRGESNGLFAERLRRERDILAGLNHPDIARLLDAGISDEGQPFLALEFVDGEPLDRYCDGHALALRARLALFVRLARAVAFAHARLVIHRDLKPSNVLVTAAGEPRLLDFGIAKLVSPEGAAQETALTAQGGRLLTPEYAAPEQIEGGPITTATDVYALGVLLFELLTGASPYRLRRHSRAALEAAILAGEPLRPSAAVADGAAAARGGSARKLRARLAGDLDTIVLRALRRAPQERYHSADALADDIERHLQGRAVLARPDAVLYRVSRLVRRHALAAAMGAAVLLALAGGLGVALWQAAQARRAAARATATKDFLVQLFEVTKIDQADVKRMRTLTAEQLLERGADRITQAFAGQPELRLELLGTVGKLLHDLDSTTRARALREVRLRDREEAHAPLPEVEEARLELADTLLARGEHQRARSLIERSIALLQPRRDRAAQLVLIDALVLATRTMPRDARQIDLTPGRRAVELAQALVPRSQRHADALFALADVVDRPEGAETLYRQGLEIVSALHGPQSLPAAVVRINLADHLAAQHQTDTAMKELLAALASVDSRAGADSVMAAELRLRIGRYYSIAGDTRRGSPYLTQGLATLERRRSEIDQESLARAHSYLGEALLDDGQVMAARAPLARALTEYPTHDIDYSVAALIYARYLVDAGRSEEAERLLEEVIALRTRILGTGNPAVTNVRNRVAVARSARRDFVGARQILLPLAGQEGPETAFGSPAQLARCNLANIDIEEGRYTRALAVLAPLHRFIEQPHEGMNRYYEQALNLRLGRAYLGLRRARQALPYLRRAVELLDGPVSPDSPALASARGFLALCLAELGDRPAADEQAALAEAAFTRQPEVGDQYKRSLATYRARHGR
jgi:serine/threonine protein kinase